MRGGQNGAHERETERARLKDRTGSIFQARSLDPVLFVSDITRKRSSADGPELMVFMNKPNSVYVPPSRQEQGVP
uniref:Uncharacterized protein n=1 Tax=Timema tahoe TaxID=61484 RepID=A0A7R9IPN3_9NEOP|nr:unnamed protein product [Timema tahoe]